MSDAPEVRFGDICAESAFGPRFSGENYSPDGNVATLRTTDMRPDGRIEYGSMPLARLDLAPLKNHILRPGDLCITRTGRVGTTAVFEEFDLPVLPGAFLIRFRLDRNAADPLYYQYFFNSPEGQRRLLSTATGSVQQNLNITALHEVPVPLPSLGEQRQIANVLRSLDDKIEQNRRTARALEGLARATFKAWFVDFEPVKAKAAGAAGFPGMPPAAFAALSDSLTDSRVGPVPRGWEVASLPQLATFLNGLALQKYPARSDGSDLPVIKIADLRRGSSVGADAANSSVPEQYVVNDGDLLFSWSGTLEVRRWFGGKGALNQHLFKVTSSRLPPWYVHHALLHHMPEFRAIASSKATTMGHIQRKHLDAALVVVAPEADLRVAEEFISPIYALTARLSTENRTLATLRDYLLPKLLSGAVRVQAPEGTGGS
jgi:type I restriction enzyme, S subunit